MAFSSEISGAAIVAGGPYYCSQGAFAAQALWIPRALHVLLFVGTVAVALTSCTTTPSLINVDELVLITLNTEATLTIDRTANLRNSSVWLFSGSKDTIVAPGVMRKLEEYYGHFVDSSRIHTVYSVPAEHSWVTSGFGNACASLGSPYINDCNFDAAAEMLRVLIDGLAPSGRSNSSNFRTFDQRPFLAPLTPREASMADEGWVYVPSSCASASPERVGAAGRLPRVLGGCRLHLAFHGCEMTYDQIGVAFVTHAGLAEVAEANAIVVLFPQAVVSSTLPYNPKGCWDWWGYTTPAFASKLGVQMNAVHAMARAMLDTAARG